MAESLQAAAFSDDHHPINAQKEPRIYEISFTKNKMSWFERNALRHDDLNAHLVPVVV